MLAGRVLRATWNPAGGLRYHLRARRHRTRAWAPFRAELDAWLTTWKPAARTLAIVGPSGGYCLPASLLARFERLLCFEPDPIARLILARRLKKLPGSREIVWFTRDLWVTPLLRDGSGGGGVPSALLTADCALLFANFLGQVAFLVPDERWPAFAAAWQVSLWPLLETIPWASFHDRVSGEIAPRLPHGESGAVQLGDEQIVALYGPDQAGELLDHRATELLPTGARYAYFDWPIVPGRHHLIEGVLGPRA